jgi:hypothetical protein
MVRRQRLNDRISTMLERRIGVSRYFFRSLFAWKMKVREETRDGYCKFRCVMQQYKNHSLIYSYKLIVKILLSWFLTAVIISFIS